MFFYHNNDLAWLCIAKNASNSWIQIFNSLGWQKEDLYQPKTDISQLKFFGLLRDPDQRHTMGVVEYLERKNLLHILDSDEFSPLLAAGVFDEHSYAVSHTVPDQVRNRTTFFIIDQSEFDYEVLVQNFLNDHGILITVPVSHLNSTEARSKNYRKRIQEIKAKRGDIHRHLMKNFLGPDILLYAQHMQQQHTWSRASDNHSRRK